MTPLFPPTLCLTLLVDYSPANHLADLRAHSFSEFRFSQRASSIQPEPSTVLSTGLASRFILMHVLKEGLSGTLPGVRWVGLYASTTGSIPGWGTCHGPTTLKCCDYGSRS